MTGSENEAEIRKTITAWAAAVRAGDIDAILKNHTPDFVMFDVPPPFESKGLAAYARTWEQFLSWSTPPVQFEIHDMTVVAGDDVAFAFAPMHCFGPNSNGRPEALNFRLTIGLRKIGGAWMIAHEHHSVPAED